MLAGCDDNALVQLPDPASTSWWDGFGASGMDDYVYALVQYDGALVAGGAFEHAGSLASPAIARWDGAAWQTLGGGLQRDDCGGAPTCHASVRAIAVSGGELVAGGRFTYAGGVAARNVARWDGGAWSPLGAGLNGTVYAVAWHQGMLVAGGEFVTSGGDTTLAHLASWDGAAWHSLGGGTNGTVRAVLSRGGELFVGGEFTIAGTMPSAHIARWDGVRWEALGGGVDGTVLALADLGDRVVVAGAFKAAGDAYHEGNIAVWDGRFWDVIGDGFWQPSALTVFQGELVAGGSPNYKYAQYNGLGHWDGREWRAFEKGIRGTVMAVCAVGSELYAGGYFTTIGELPSRHIARWDGSIARAGAMASAPVPGPARR